MLMTTFAETRRNKILEALARERYLKVADLSQRFRVSQMSIRRDLYYLEEQGLLQRVHGGIVATPLLRLGLEISPDVSSQLRDRRPENEDIARLAATLIMPGDHLILDSGVITYLTACALPGDLLTQGELTVITHSLPVALELAPWPGIETILLGGEYQAGGMMNLTGPSTLRSLHGLHADKMFMTAEAIDILHGVTISKHGLEGELIRSMIAACNRLVLLVNSGKIGQVCRQPLLPISAVECVVIGQGAPADFISYLRTLGSEVLLAKPGLRNPIREQL